MSKSQNRPGKMLGFYADEKIDERLTLLAEKAKVSKSQLVKNLVECTLDQMEALDRVGLLSMGVFYDDFKENFRRSVEATITQVLHPEEVEAPLPPASPLPPSLPDPEPSPEIRVTVIGQSLPGLD